MGKRLDQVDAHLIDQSRRIDATSGRIDQLRSELAERIENVRAELAQRCCRLLVRSPWGGVVRRRAT